MNKVSGRCSAYNCGMPSLPELEVYKADFSAELVGQKITGFDALDFRDVRADVEKLKSELVGSAFTAVHRYGKWLYFDFGGADQLILHLGLTGKFSLGQASQKLPRYACFKITFADGRELLLTDQRHLGRLYLGSFEAIKSDKKLGPDQLAVGETYFTDTLAKKRRGVRDVLMDQHVIAGIGGKYADEVLWQAKLHPNTKLDKLPKAKLVELYQILKQVTDTAISLDGDVDRFPADWLIPHRRTDKICPRCGAPLTERKLGGSETFYCPVDQPAPNPFRSG
jgi:formamidopyrimidine-DNA glycosylase